MRFCLEFFFASFSNEGSGEPKGLYRLNRAFAAHIQEVWITMKIQIKI